MTVKRGRPSNPEKGSTEALLKDIDRMRTDMVEMSKLPGISDEERRKSAEMARKLTGEQIRLRLSVMKMEEKRQQIDSQRKEHDVAAMQEIQALLLLAFSDCTCGSKRIEELKKSFSYGLRTDDLRSYVQPPAELKIFDESRDEDGYEDEDIFELELEEEDWEDEE